MPYDVLIRKNATGEIRRRKIDDLWDDVSLYLWTEGNFGCDCNRHLDFERAADHDPGDDWPCGELAYTVIKAILPTGQEIAIDEEIAK
jgi:hypothetical protein